MAARLNDQTMPLLDRLVHSVMSVATQQYIDPGYVGSKLQVLGETQVREQHNQVYLLTQAKVFN